MWIISLKGFSSTAGIYGRDSRGNMEKYKSAGGSACVLESARWQERERGGG